MATTLLTSQPRILPRQISHEASAILVTSQSFRRAVPPADRTDPLRPVERRDLWKACGPVVDEIELAGVNLPSHEACGNFQNWALLDPHRLLIAVGQAHDRTVNEQRERLFVQATWTALRAHADHVTDAGKLLTHVGRTVWCDSVGGQFISLAVALVDTIGGRVDLAIAGQGLAMRIRASSCRPVRFGQPPIGFEPDADYQCETLELRPRERLALAVGTPTRESDPWGKHVAKVFQGLDAPTHRQMSASEALARIRSVPAKQFAGNGENAVSVAVIRRR